MEYVYSAMLLHSAKHEINEDNVTKVMGAAGIKADSSRVKSLVASLKEVNIDEAIEKAAMQPVAAPPLGEASPQAFVSTQRQPDSRRKWWTSPGHPARRFQWSARPSRSESVRRPVGAPSRFWRRH